MRFIESMRKFGMRFALDDFGSGVSSFGYLKSLPVDYLKIDGQFIRELKHDLVDQATVRCIRDVVRLTGKKTVAEFVETEAVETLLRKEEPPVAAPAGTIGAPVEQLDLATVIKVSQAVSGEIVLDKLIDTLMRTAMAQAGAERALLILSPGAGERVAAEATTDGDTVNVQLCDEAVTTIALPESVLHYVLRTQESVLVDDASAENSFAADPYVRQHRARSILRLPLVTQAKLIGMLYLENNLAPHVFVPARLAVLKLLASQAAIALENTRLYRDLAAREAKIRRLVDANIIGIFVWQVDGAILEANDAFLGMMGYEREDLISGRLRWTDLTPPKWREADEQALAQVVNTGRAQPFEKEYVRKDGRRVPVMVGGTSFEAGGKEGVAFVLDLTERKRAEEEARESERRYREVQTELAHANRVDTIGQLAASIAHEVTQPIAATVTSAEAGLRAKPSVDTMVDRGTSHV
jgi:PAS domain S-box-containing protein